MITTEEATKIKTAHGAIGKAICFMVKKNQIDVASIMDAMGLWITQMAIQKNMSKQDFTNTIQHTWDMISGSNPISVEHK